LGMNIELQGHYIAYDLGILPNHSNPAALGQPDWDIDPTAAISEALAGLIIALGDYSILN